MLTKSAPFEFKSIDDAGTFEATVAVFGNVDKGGDRIINCAFTNSLERWQQSGDPIPVIFNHDWSSPHAHIGVVEHAEETDRGLWVKGRLDVTDNDVARGDTSPSPALTPTSGAGAEAPDRDTVLP